MEMAEMKQQLFRIRPDDVIAAMLLKLPDQFKADEEAIHKTITGLSKDNADLFGWFEITSDYPYPFSRCLERVLHRLGQSRLLGTWNPDFSTYTVDKESKKTIELRIWPKFDDQQQMVLENAASKLADAVCLSK